MTEPQGAGDCFEVAVHLMLHEYANDNTAVLVHGWAVGTGPENKGKRYWHAWVEYSQTFEWNAEPGTALSIEVVTVVDKSNGNDAMLPKAFYYKVGDISRTWRYSHEEACAEMFRLGHYGPWVDDDPGEEECDGPDSNVSPDA